MSREKPSRLLDGVTFGSIFLLVIFIIKRIFSSPEGDLNFLLRLFGTAISSVVITTFVLAFVKRRYLAIVIIICLALVVVLGVTKR
jgi:asparagine N-glycosylation enzyme membrane subunit Stt3